ncbi:MAG: ComEC/Rec2 family competence protein [Lachnospiraceae bacterium]|nr:ComEC/Rec2 family competence protein [Lachnospiraceae bacterium]
MSGRSICRMAICFLLGIVSILYWDSHCGYIIAAWLACIICMQYRQSRRRVALTVMVNIILIAAGACTAYVAQAQYNSYDEILPDGMHVTFQGKIYKKEYKSDSLIYYLQDVYLQSDHFLSNNSDVLNNSNGAHEISCSKIILCIESDDYPIGTICVGKGRIKAFSVARNEGNFDERQYYNSLGIVTRLDKCTILQEYHPFNMGFVSEALFQLRRHMTMVYVEYLPGEEAGIMSTIALGDKSNLDSEAKELFQTSGIAHLLSVSGLHISVVAMSLYNFLRKRRLGFVSSGIVSIVVLGLYANMVGMGLPVRRAMIMYVIYIVGMMLGEAYDSLTALAIAEIIMMLENPLVVMNTGFVFSFSAVIGVVTFATELKKIYEKWWLLILEKRNIRKQEQPLLYRLIHKVLGALVFSVGVTLSTIPIVGHMYYEIPVYSMILNFLLLPLMPVLLGCGLIGGVLFPLSTAGIQGIITEIIMLPSHLILYLYEMVADLTLKLPGARQIVGCLPIWKIGLYYLLLYVLIYRLLPCLVVKTGDSTRRENKLNVGLKLIVIFSFIFAILIPSRGNMEIDMIDCGQGDAIYICDGHGVNCFIDGGSTSVKKVGKYRILPFLKYRGVRRIDFWFISHTDEDHISGLREAIEDGYDIRHIIFSEGMDVKDLGELAESHGIEVDFISQGDQVVIGYGSDELDVNDELFNYSSKADKVVFTCLYPSSDSGFEGPNENSMVLLMEYGSFQAIFTGDIGADQEKWMLNDEYARSRLENALVFDDEEARSKIENKLVSDDEEARSKMENKLISDEEKASEVGVEETTTNGEKRKGEGIELLKVPHHGSKYSNSKEFLELIAPHYSIISAGEKNRYGHPSKDAIARMDELNLAHYCTIDCGQIRIIPGKEGDCTVESLLRILH